VVVRLEATGVEYPAPTPMPPPDVFKTLRSLNCFPCYNGSSQRVTAVTILVDSISRFSGIPRSSQLFPVTIYGIAAYGFLLSAFFYAKRLSSNC
jgi:hypothetical protein